VSRDRDSSPVPYNPPSERRGHATPRASYAPARGPVVDTHDERHHPLHRVYRRRIRGVRWRWFTSGLTLGILLGIFFTLLASALIVAQIPGIAQSFSGQPDLAVVIGEGYLNREAANRIGGSQPTDVPGLTLTGATLDLKPDNRMDLVATFKIEVMFVTADVNATVQNQITVQDGALVINMVGNPKLGNLNVPLNLLPFDLEGEITRIVDRVNNEMIITEINQSLQSGFGGTDFAVEGVTTDDSGMTIRLQQR
jgi:hypothetical protein